MKVAIYPDTPVEKIPAEADAIHLVRPIGVKKLESVLARCPKCSEVTLSKSCSKRLPAKARKAVQKAGASIVVDSRRGRAIGIPLEKMMKVIELRKDYQSLREIERLTEVPKSTIHYLVKYADRGKVKKGNIVIYLK